MKKFLKILGVSAIAAMCAATMAACGGGNEDGNGGDEENNVPAGSQQYIFEAEYVDCSGIDNAPGFSGGGGQTDIVAYDMYELGASNGFYTTYLYGNGVTLEFKITSDKAVSDATIVARLSAEGGQDFTISTSNYKFTVNDTELQFSPIQFKNVPALGQAPLKFTDYTIARNVSLKEGENIIKLITSNTTSLGGTTEATAPMVDCIKVTTSAALTWNPVESNLDNF